MKLEAPQIPWIEPWRPVNEEQAEGLADELHREICNREHVLFGRTIICVGYSYDLYDDFLFYLGPTPPSFAFVHLTWSRESRRDWPYTKLYETIEDWIEQGMKPAALDYERTRRRPD